MVNQLFGVMTGLGMSSLTFDWSQISYIGSPLIVPWWAIANIIVGFVAIYWILAPILYYTNVSAATTPQLVDSPESTPCQTWGSGYLPISTNAIFDRFGAEYNVSAIINEAGELDAAAYRAYSPLYFPTTYVIVYLIAFALATSILVHTALYYGQDMWKTFKNIKNAQTDIHAKLMLAYREVPTWWYMATLVAFAAMSIALVEVRAAVPQLRDTRSRVLFALFC